MPSWVGSALTPSWVGSDHKKGTVAVSGARGEVSARRPNDVGCAPFIAGIKQAAGGSWAFLDRYPPHSNGRRMLCLASERWPSLRLYKVCLPEHELSLKSRSCWQLRQAL